MTPMTPMTPMVVTDFLTIVRKCKNETRPSLWGHTAGHALLAFLFDQPGPRQAIQAPAAWKGHESLPKKKIEQSWKVYKFPLKSWGRFTLKMMGERMVILFLWNGIYKLNDEKSMDWWEVLHRVFGTQGAILHEFSIQFRCHQPKHATTGTKCVGNWMILLIVQFTGPRSSSIISVIQQLGYMIGIRINN